MKIIRKAATGLVQKIHNKTGYILNTSKEQRKADRKVLRKTRRHRISQFRPFGFLDRRDLNQERKDDLGVSNPIPE